MLPLQRQAGSVAALGRSGTLTAPALNLRSHLPLAQLPPQAGNARPRRQQWMRLRSSDGAITRAKWASAAAQEGAGEVGSHGSPTVATMHPDPHGDGPSSSHGGNGGGDRGHAEAAESAGHGPSQRNGLGLVNGASTSHSIGNGSGHTQLQQQQQQQVQPHQQQHNGHGSSLSTPQPAAAAPAAADTPPGTASSPASPSTASTPSTSTPPDPNPSVYKMLGRMLVFSIPISSIVLAEPLLAFTTSLFIGQFGSNAELAALGPANIVISFTHYVFSSISISTLGMLTALLRGGDEKGAQKLLSGALGLAAVCGLLAAATWMYLPEPLIQATGMKDPEVIAHACNFLRVRAWGQIALVVAQVSQSAFLAQQDSVAPAGAAIVATCLAIGLHVLLVGGWWQPLASLAASASAIIATFFAGAAAVPLVGPAAIPPLVPGLPGPPDAVLTALASPGPGAGLGLVGAGWATTVGNLTAAALLLRGLAVRGVLRPLLQVPSLTTLRSLAATMAPLAVTYVTKNWCYIAIQSTAASILSVTALAAHQAIFAAWAFVSFWVAPSETAVLAMAPAAPTPAARRATMAAGLMMGVLIGLVGGILVSCIATWAPGLLSSDASLWPLLRQVAGISLVTMVMTGLDVSACAVNIAGGDANYVAQSFVLTLLIVMAFMAFVRYTNGGFMGIWQGITVFFIARSFQSGLRAWSRHIKEEGPAQPAGLAAAPAPAAG